MAEVLLRDWQRSAPAVAKFRQIPLKRIAEKREIQFQPQANWRITVVLACRTCSGEKVSERGNKSRTCSATAVIVGEDFRRPAYPLFLPLRIRDAGLNQPFQ